MINGKSTEMLVINWKIQRRIVLSIFIMFMLCMPSVTMLVKAADWIVDDDGTGDYFTIQDAIDDASAGDTIWVKDGSYNEQLHVHKSVRIIADNGAEPIIYVTSYSPGIDVTASNTTIEGFKIYGNSNPGGGPVIRASAGADMLGVKNNLFVAISGEIGNVALQVVSGVSEVEFTSNSVTEYDIGVLLQDHCMAQISGSFTHVSYPVYHAALIDGTNTYYGSIQDAIDNASAGDTIDVKLGSYNENIVINISMTLEGAQAGVNPVGGRSGEESIIDGNILSAIRIDSGTTDVTVNGFTLTISSKDPLSNQAGVLIGSNTDNIDVINNIIENITDGSGGPGSDTLSDETYGIMVYGHSGSDNQTNITISNNLIQNVEEYGIAINDNTSHVTISDNHITEMIGSDHTGEVPPWDPSWPAIICAAIHLGGQLGPINDVTIEDNILNANVTGDGSSSAAGGGILFKGIQETALPNRNWQGFEQISIIDNKIFNNTMGIVALAGMSNGSIEVHDNNISDNSLFGINNGAVNASFNATENWWGNISGPYNATDNPTGTGDNVTGNVTFWPWYEFDGYSIPPSVDYDIEGPQVSYGEIIRETTEIEINAEDDESGMYSLTYRIWNTTHRWGPWTNYTGPFTLPGQGNHRVQYNATDNAGTSAYPTKPWGYYERHRVDDVSPIVNVVYPNGGEFEYGVITIEWTSADRIFDQGQLQQNGSIPLTEDYPGHIQSFIPTEDSIDSVQLLVSGDDANVSVKLFNEIYPVPTVIGQSVKRIQNIGAPAWIDFPFSSSIDLDTTKTYYIGITQQIHGDTGFVWFYFNDPVIDRYPFGHAWVKETDALVNESSMDFAFKTMYWDTDVDISVKYTNVGTPPWSTIAEGELNDGIYFWDTVSYGIPDGPNYRIKIEAFDEISNIGYDESDENFIIDNEGPGIYNINITDTTISDSFFTKNGDNIEITASISGDPETITADLSGFGKGTEVNYSSFTGGIAKWAVSDILCSPPNGVVSVTITARDATGDSGSNTGTITADNAKPTITITKPRPGLYFLDSMRLLPFSYPFIIGQITFETEASDNGSGVSHVEFYLENDLEATVTEPPYRWLWDYAATGFFDVEIKAVDRVGHETSDEITDLFIINLDIIGHD